MLPEWIVGLLDGLAGVLAAFLLAIFGIPLQQLHGVRDLAQLVRDARSYGRRGTEPLVDANEVVEHEERADRRGGAPASLRIRWSVEWAGACVSAS